MPGVPAPHSDAAEPEPPVDVGTEIARGGLADRMARGAGLAGAGFVLSRGLTFATYLIVAQLIDPRDAGQLAAGEILVGFGFVFAESGMLAALIHWKEDLDRAASTATVSTIVSGVLLTLLALATAPLVGTFFHSSTIGWVAAASSGLLMLRSIQIVPDALLARQFAFVRRITVDPLGALANLVVAVACCAAGMGVWGLLLGQYALYVSQGVAAWGLLKWRPQRRLVSMDMWRQLARYARHVVASEIVRRSTAQLDSLLLGRVSSNALGQYAYGMRIASTPTDAWVSVASYALLPAFSRIADEADRFRRAFTEALGAMLFVGLPVSLLLLVTGDQLALFFFGPEWPRSGTAIEALAGVGFGQMLTSISSEVFKAAGRPSLLTRTHSLTAAMSVIALPGLMLLFDDNVLGIAVAVSLVSLLTGVYAIVTAARLIGASLTAMVSSLGGLIVAGECGVAAGLAVELAFDPSRRLPALLAATVTSLAITVVYVAFVRILAPSHYRRIAGAVGRLRRRGGGA